MIVAAGSGVALAFAEANGFRHTNEVFTAVGATAFLVFVGGVFVAPYLKFKELDFGFRFTDHLNEEYTVRWAEVVKICVDRTDGELEWFIKTADGALVCVMDNEFFYRGRLRRGAIKHLPYFDEGALRQAVSSKLDGSWLCYQVAAER